MNVSEIRNTGIKNVEPMVFKKNIAPNTAADQAVDKIEVSSASVSWQKDILLSALDMLENNKQLDDSHPLDRAGNAPIESFDEALIEINFLKSSNFKEQAYGAQANINAKDVLYLFVEDAA